MPSEPTIAIWVVSAVIAAVAAAAARTPIRAFAVGSVASFVLLYVAVSYVGHPIVGLSLLTLVLAALVPAAGFAGVLAALNLRRRG